MEIFRYKNYEIDIQRRSFQKSVNILVKPDGKIKMTMGKTVSRRRIVSCLVENEVWLENVIRKVEELKRMYPEPKYNSGDQLLYMGRKIPFYIKETNKKRPFAKLIGEEIHLFSCEGEGIEIADKKKAVQNFYKSSGIEVLKKVVQEQSDRMKLFPVKVTFRSQKTRWGSCSSAGDISLNWKLIFSPPETIEYVVIHELAHLVHQNHSSNFWGLVERYSPEFKDHKDWLNLRQQEIATYNF